MHRFLAFLGFRLSADSVLHLLADSDKIRHGNTSTAHPVTAHSKAAAASSSLPSSFVFYSPLGCLPKHNTHQDKFKYEAKSTPELDDENVHAPVHQIDERRQAQNREPFGFSCAQRRRSRRESPIISVGLMEPSN
jgi:hypothetical protein